MVVVRKQMGAFDVALLKRIDAARGDVPRVRWVQRVLEEKLDDADFTTRAYGLPAEPVDVPPAPLEEPPNETPLPKVARRHWS